MRSCLVNYSVVVRIEIVSENRNSYDVRMEIKQTNK